MDINYSTTALIGARELWEEDKDDKLDWCPEQDNQLQSLVTVHGIHNWSLVAEQLNANFAGIQKTGKQCRERWCNKLDPSVNHSPWAKQEEGQLILSHMKFKNRWCDIAADLKGRHNNMIKNRFYSIFRKVKNKVLSDDYSFKTKLELVEMHYMISVMEYYAANPLPFNEPKRKRGKDFMYTLIEDISPDRLERFKQGLSRRAPLRGPPEQVLREMLAMSHPGQPSALKAPSISVAPIEAMEIAISSTPYAQSKSNTAPKKSGTFLPVCTLFALPTPHSYTFEEPLSAEEKESFRRSAFIPSTIEPPGLGTASQPSFLSATTRSTTTGFQQLKGGFGDCSSLKEPRSNSHLLPCEGMISHPSTGKTTTPKPLFLIQTPAASATPM